MPAKEIGARLEEALANLATLGTLELDATEMTPGEYTAWVVLLTASVDALTELHEFILEIQTRRLRSE